MSEQCVQDKIKPTRVELEYPLSLQLSMKVDPANRGGSRDNIKITIESQQDLLVKQIANNKMELTVEGAFEISEFFEGIKALHDAYRVGIV